MPKSVMQHSFQNVPKAEINRSSFDRSHGYKTTFDAGYLIPFYTDEALPGDTFNLSATLFARLATPIKPFMDNLFCETFFFSVPVRQIWDNWEKFNGEQENPDSSTDFIVPRMQGSTPSVESLDDYFGIPVGVSGSTPNALHYRAYNHIYNNWFRDQNLIDSAVWVSGDGPDGNGIYNLLRRRKRPDYFTSCLPWPQKGDPVTVPLGDSAPVLTSGVTNDVIGIQQPGIPGSSYTINNTPNPSQLGTPISTDANLYADLSAATGFTINDLRQSFQIQKMLERDARGGTRYPELLKSHFGVTDPQMLVLQRPEFLGGSSQPININPVAQTTEEVSSGTVQGNLAAYGTMTMRNSGFTKSFTEHCVLIGIVNVRADLTYQQGLNRMWSRQTRFDYYWPALQGLGEMAVLNKEIYRQDTAADDLVFGYQEAWGDYRYKPSLITGKMRSTDPTSLDIWHLSQEFSELPVLGQDFIEDNPPIDRVIAVQDEPHFLLDAYFKLRCARPMPTYGVPGLIDHF